MKKLLLFLGVCCIAGWTFAQQLSVEKLIPGIKQQINLSLERNEKNGGLLNPVHIKEDGTVRFCGYGDWRSGFFPGSLWYLYELTGDMAYLSKCRAYTESLRKAENIKSNHDIGFIVMCSFGNGYRLTKDTTYAATIVNAAKSLMTRFREKPEVIQGWNVDKGWMSKRGWECPVIIDNMMNLELLFKATALTGDSVYYKTAVAHADRTLKEHFRKDGSCYHVVDYDLKIGKVRSRQTAQGYAHESIWSRGQAWAIYGYTMCYRETHDRRYLLQALKTFEMMRTHKNMPADCIPYWDMDAPDIPDTYRDVSSASCIASALYELSTFDIPEAEICREYADKIMISLSAEPYKAPVGTNEFFLLKHSVGSIPHNGEVDVPLNYADYYYLEALKRMRDIEK